MSHRRTGSRSSLTPSVAGEANALLSPGQSHGDFGSPLSSMNGHAGGFGSLEDELAGAWDQGDEEDEDDEDDMYREQDMIANGIDTSSPIHSPTTVKSSRPTSSHTVQSPSSPHSRTPNGVLSPPYSKPRRHTHTRSSSNAITTGPDDTGVKYHLDDLPPELRMLIKDVEDLAIQGTKMFIPSSSRTTSPTDSQQYLTSGPHTPPPTHSSRPTPDANIATLLAHLRNLSQQTTLETQTSRLITAHTALTSHITHQTRSLQTAAYPLLSPFHPSPNAADTDALLSLLHTALETLPQPSFTSLNSLAHLSTTGRDAVASLAVVSDSLHMSRQLEATAARRLKSARECAAELRREFEQAEEGVRWIEGHGWGDRIAQREAGRVCREVTGGFEEVCEGWRRRLVGGKVGA